MPLSRQMELELVRRWRERHDRKAYDLLIMSQKPVVTFISYQYSSPGLDQEDLWQAGWLGVTRALQTFDPARGFRLSTYAANWVRNYVSDIAGNNRKHRALTTSIEHQVNQGGDEPLTIGDLLTAPDLDPRCDEHQILFDASLDTWRRTLNRRERYVIARRYFGELPTTLTQVGKELHLSRERIRQIEAAALSKMRRCLHLDERKSRP